MAAHEGKDGVLWEPGATLDPAFVQFVVEAKPDRRSLLCSYAPQSRPESRSYSDATRSDSQEFAEIVLVRIEKPLETGDLLVGGRVKRKAEVDDARVAMMLAEDQIAEVSVIRDEDSVLAHGNGEHFIVREARRIVFTNSSRVMVQTAEKDSDPGLRALVKQKSHRGAGAGLGRASPCIVRPLS